MNQSDAAIEHIGNYYLLDLLGKSDLSEVYRAEHSESHEQVAIKILYGRWEENEAQKFFTQIETMQQLNHPHIIPIFDSGITDDGIAFIIMKYASKGSLRQLHPRGTRVPLETIVNYVNQITSALSYIHELGLVHRDIKPHNLLMDTDDQIMLIDFGAATTSHSIHPVEASQREFEGTVPYAAPEQLRGKSRRNSDQYALGIMVYEWITGNWPFDGTFHEMTHQHLFVSPPRFQERNIICPTNIEQVVRRTLEKDPAKRFPNVKSFAEEFEWACKVAQARGQTLSIATVNATDTTNNAPASIRKETEVQNIKATYGTEIAHPEKVNNNRQVTETGSAPEPIIQYTVPEQAEPVPESGIYPMHTQAKPVPDPIMPYQIQAQTETAPEPGIYYPAQASDAVDEVESNLEQIIQSMRASHNNEAETENKDGAASDLAQIIQSIKAASSKQAEMDMIQNPAAIQEPNNERIPPHTPQAPTETSPAKSRNQFKSPKPFSSRERQQK